MATSFESLIPPRTDRVLLAGQTGSGKTTLAEVLLRFRKYVVVLDGKGTIKWPGYFLVRAHKELLALNPEKVPKIIYRPDFSLLESEEEANTFFKWVYQRQNTTLYVDELAGVSRGMRAPYYWGASMMRGRERKVEVMNGTQRPTDIPTLAMSEAEHVFCFRLRMPQDRAKMEAVAGIPAERIAALDKRQFLYSAQEGGIRGPFNLDLTAKKPEATL